MGGSYERLTALDSVFLDIEDRTNHMHVAATLVFDAGPLRDGEGRLDVPRIRRYVASVLRYLPRWRQRLARVPLLGDPVWVDDTGFDPSRHVRHLHLGPSGDEATLRRVVGDIYSEQLDRRFPLWELTVLEGLEGDRFAMVAKVHHCMVDGVAGMAVLATLLRPAPTAEIEPVGDWRPKPPPHPLRLLGEDIVRRLRAPAVLGRRARRALREPGSIAREAMEAVRGVLAATRTGIRPTTRTPLNPPKVGPRRAVAWTRFELAEVKRLERATSAKVNDIVLATVAGAIRRFFEHRRFPTQGLEFRVMVPVSTHGRAEGSRGSWGNEVSLMLAPLPIGEPDPRTRLDLIRDTMRELKSTGESHVIALGEELADWTAMSLVTVAVEGLIRWRPYNVIVTNVPGPPVPLYLLDAPLRAAYPMVPLYGNQAVGLALVSYAGGLYWGLDADRELVPDLDVMVRGLERSFEELAEACTNGTDTVGRDLH